MGENFTVDAVVAGLRPIDDEFMRTLFEDTDFTEYTLRKLTGINDLKINEPITQKHIKLLGGSRSVCLDVYARDTKGRLYNIEIQKDEYGADPRRPRYNLSAIDVHNLKKGEDFRKLCETYVIFLMEGDYFGRGASIYQFDRIDRKYGIELNDGTHIVYANASCKDDTEVGKLLRGFLCSDPKDIECEILRRKVETLKSSKTGGAPMSKIVREFEENAMKRGAETNALNNIRSLINNTGWSVQQAMDALGIPGDVREEYCEKLKQEDKL